MQRHDAWTAWLGPRVALAVLLALACCGERADRTRGDAAELVDRRADPAVFSGEGRRVAPPLDVAPPEGASGEPAEFSAVLPSVGDAPLAERGGDLTDFAGVDLAADSAGTGGGLSTNVYSRLVG